MSHAHLQNCRILEGSGPLGRSGLRRLRNLESAFSILPDDEAGREWLRTLGWFHASDLRGQGQVIAIIDSGYDPLNEVVDQSVLAEKCCDLTGEGIADENGHGTLVSLLLLAAVPDASLVHIKAFRRNSQCAGATIDEQTKTFTEALRRAAAAGATVINVSAGFIRDGLTHHADGPHNAYCICPICCAAADCLRTGSIYVVAAAGNEPIPRAWERTSFCPAAGPGVLPVVALHRQTPLFFPVYPSPCFGASGVIPSIPPRWFPKSLRKWTFGSSIKGSSFAAPLMSGAVALVKQLFAGWIPHSPEVRLLFGNPLTEQEAEDHEVGYFFKIQDFFSTLRHRRFENGKPIADFDQKSTAAATNHYQLTRLADEYLEKEEFELARRAYALLARWMANSESIWTPEHILRAFHNAIYCGLHCDFVPLPWLQELCDEADTFAARFPSSEPVKEQMKATQVLRDQVEKVNHDLWVQPFPDIF